MHNNHHPEAWKNIDLEDGWTRKMYLDMTKNWKMPDGIPALERHNGYIVVAEHQHGIGSKARFGDLLVSETLSDTLVYVAPRVGMAGISLAHLAKRYNKRLVLFCPAAKEPSNHQLRALEEGAELRWVRIAAMPVLQRIAQRWAEDKGHVFLPLGLKHRLVTAAIVRVCDEMMREHKLKPEELWCATSTGVLSRGLAIGFPNAIIHSVAVSRNLKYGEAGTPNIWSYPKPFQAPSDVLPPFNSIHTYDAKAWHMMTDYARDRKPGKTWFWNVAGEQPEAPRPRIKSDRSWYDETDVKKS
ncbi:hypothetical protein UFOVP435_78 [uncultured Caudovirales phage]|uniref:Tryptophan synthase beta chain-like PALP domain-containing protein n=1 Tax=uncultured Caudovirales phage TaxID=2100421 RepID=A0A6J5M940_9CAUD|nr:hypothetical protein UFOVP435_78 [uncultured Caudovirales phage]